jgi:hypothetical protein
VPSRIKGVEDFPPGRRRPGSENDSGCIAGVDETKLRVAGPDRVCPVFRALLGVGLMQLIAREAGAAFTRSTSNWIGTRCAGLVDCVSQAGGSKTGPQLRRKSNFARRGTLVTAGFGLPDRVRDGALLNCAIMSTGRCFRCLWPPAAARLFTDAAVCQQVRLRPRCD